MRISSCFHWNINETVLTFASARGIATLCYEVWNDAMKHGPIVVTLYAQLHKVPASQGGLFGPQLHIYISQCGLEKNLSQVWIARK